MPLYDFVCDNCGNKEEYGIPVAYRDATQVCTNCGNVLRRVFSPQTIVMHSSVATHTAGDAIIRERKDVE